MIDSSETANEGRYHYKQHRAANTVFHIPGIYNNIAVLEHSKSSSALYKDRASITEQQKLEMH